jgi:hypothetical protein
MKIKRQKNLWNVKYETQGKRVYESLWILAASAERAATKALSFVQRGEGPRIRVRILDVEWSGTIDVF